MAARRVAVDIGSTMVRVVEVELRGGPDPREGATIHALGEAAVPAGVVKSGDIEEPAALAHSVRMAFANAKPSSKNVVIGVSSPNIVTREMDIPAQPMASLRDSLAFHVNDTLPTVASDTMFDFYPTLEFDGPGGAHLRGILVAAPRNSVQALIRVVQSAGLKPAAVDHNAFALWRGACRLSMTQANVAFVDVGASATTVVVSQAGVPRLIRTLPLAGKDASQAIASAAKGTPVDIEDIKRRVGMSHDGPREYQVFADAVAHSMNSLVESVRNTITYFAASTTSGAIERVVLTGGSAYLPGLGQALATTARVPVSIGDPFIGLARGKKASAVATQGREASFATALGLAMGGSR